MLKFADHQQRNDFTRAFLWRTDDETFTPHPITSDEAHIIGHVNKQNCRFFCDENPRIIHEQPLHAQKVTVWWPQLQDLDMHNLWFQQDGATPHTAAETMAMLRAAFPGRLISCFGDLSRPDFFLWGHLKGKVYINIPNTLYQLKNNIIHEIIRIILDILEEVMENTIRRICLCLKNNEEHLKDIIFK